MPERADLSPPERDPLADLVHVTSDTGGRTTSRARDEAKEERGGNEEASVAREPAEDRKARPFGGLTPAEAARRRAAVARERRAAREAAAEEDRLTARQRLATALSLELSVEDWRGVIRTAVAGGKTADLARMLDQAFGKSRPEEEDPHAGEDDDVRTLTRAQRAALIAKILEEEEENARESAPAGRPDDPREEPGGGTPLPRES
ncbi:MAG: hypothetical protein K0S82_1783 [Gaiellaceae bacterium]|nr:hypothetical protein [Gaiellaceae bacterium]